MRKKNNHSMNISENNQLECKLNQSYHQIALDFAKQQKTVEKGKTVYLNTLAVCTVNTLLKQLSYETLLDKSYSWNPIIRCFEDVADLVVADLGRIECLPLVGDESIVNIPKEVRKGRIAYIVVQFQEILNSAKILGFYRCPDRLLESETINLADLEPIDNLIDYLFFLELELERERKFIKIGVDLLDSNNDLAMKIKRIAEKIKAELTTQSYEEIISRFLKLSRENIKKHDRPALGKNILAEVLGLNNASFASVRGSTKSKEDYDIGKELFSLAAELYHELEELWEDEL